MNEDKARALAKRFGVRMCDENGDTHDEELYCLGLDDIIDMAKALAQPEQEPVAWIYEFYADMGHKGLAFEEQRSAHNTPLYATPPQRKPLTPAQRHEVAVKAEAAIKVNPNLSWRDALITQTEAAHGIKE